MPFEISLKNLPAGYSLSAARKGDQNVRIAFCEFLSSEDGDNFISRLDGFPSEIISHLPSSAGVIPSQVDHLLAIIKKDKTATVYVNELDIIGEILSKRSVKAGEAIQTNDVAGIKSIKLKNVSIPSNAGFFFVFSVGWRKGIFYDFLPLSEKYGHHRNYDLEKRLATYFTYLTFQNRFKISHNAWENFFKHGWFPFIGLTDELICHITTYAENNWNIDDLIPEIRKNTPEICDRIIKRTRSNKNFSHHSKIILTAIDRFLSDDYISTSSILYPRIEGLMRSASTQNSFGKKHTQQTLIETSISATDANGSPNMLLLPEKFQTYLKEIYFCSFDPNNPQGLSRNTIAHGVAPLDAFTEKAAVIALLILDQLSFYFTP